MKLYVGLTLVCIAVMLTGCGGGEATPAADESLGEAYTSDTLDASYDGALNVRNQLALGTLFLEETENAVTPEQATAMLPFWQALQGGVTAQAEVDAVLKQIEGVMTSEQLEAIAAKQLTQDDLRGLGIPPGGGSGQGLSPDERATRQAERGGGGMPPEVATRRAEMENMSEEERESLRATAQAGGMPGGPGGRAGGGPGQFIILLDPLIELLTQRAAE